MGACDKRDSKNGYRLRARHCESGVCNECDAAKKELVTCAVQQKIACLLRGVWVALARSGRILVCGVLRFGVCAAASNRKKCDPIVGAELVGAVCEFWCRIGGRCL